MSYIRVWEAICVFCWKRLPHTCSQLCPASRVPTAPGFPPPRASHSPFTEPLLLLWLMVGKAPFHTGPQLHSLWQHCSEGLGFLPIRIDSKRGHLTFAEAVGCIGRKPVKPPFIEWTSPYLIYRWVSQSGLQPYYPRLNFCQIFFTDSVGLGQSDTLKTNCQQKSGSESDNSVDDMFLPEVLLSAYWDPGLVLLFEIWKAAFHSLRA